MIDDVGRDWVLWRARGAVESRGVEKRGFAGVRVLLGLKNQRRLLRRREGVLCGLYKPALHNEIPRSSSLSTVASYKTRLKQCLKVPSEHHSTLAAPLWMAAMALWQKIAATTPRHRGEA